MVGRRRTRSRAAPLAARCRQGAAAALLALCSWSCGEERPPPLSDGSARPVEGCEHFSYRTCDILTSGCQRELFELMACLRDEDVAAVGPPPVSLLTEEEAEAML